MPFACDDQARMPLSGAVQYHRGRHFSSTCVLVLKPAGYKRTAGADNKFRAGGAPFPARI